MVELSGPQSEKRRRYTSRKVGVPMSRLAIAAAILLMHYGGTGVSASGTGVAITGLQPTGSAIAGNEPYAVDNLVSAAEPHLTKHGFGFSLANHNYANPFYNGSSYYEYLSVPPYTNGAGPERPVLFSTVIVPEPSAASVMLAGLLSSSASPEFSVRQTSTETSSISRPSVIWHSDLRRCKLARSSRTQGRTR